VHIFDNLVTKSDLGFDLKTRPLPLYEDVQKLDLSAFETQEVTRLLQILCGEANYTFMAGRRLNRAD